MPSFDQFMEAKTRIQSALAEQVKDDTSIPDLRVWFDRLIAVDPVYFTESERDNLFGVMQAELLGVPGDQLEGYGPLLNLLDDPQITDIMINNYDTVYIEKFGMLERSAHVFASNDHLLAVLQRVAADFGRKLDESHPIVDLRFPDGSTGHLVAPPIAQRGPAAVFRKARKVQLTLAEMVENGALSADAARYLKEAVEGMQNIIVTGVASSGKTTLLAALGRAMDDAERLIVIQETDVPLRKPHQVVLENRPANLEGRGEITIEQLIMSAGRMLPERILVDSARSGNELIRLLQLVQTGHRGIIFVMQAGGTRELLAHIEVLLGEANPSAPVLVHREAISRLVDVIVTTTRGRDGQYHVVSIAEVSGMDGSLLVVRERFQRENDALIAIE